MRRTTLLLLFSALAMPFCEGFAEVFTYTTLNIPGSPVGINNIGQILTTSGIFDRHTGVFTAINFPGTPTGLNDAGEIVGYIGSFNPPSFNSSGFLYSGGMFSLADNVSGGAGTAPLAIDNHSDIVGVFGVSPPNPNRFNIAAFLINGASQRALCGFAPAIATGINNLGQFVGNSYSYPSTLPSAFLNCADPGGVFAAEFPIEFKGINDGGQIIGTKADSGSGLHGGFVWDAPYRPETDSQSTIFSILGTPLGINNAGEIVGTYVDSTGVTRGYLAEPVPEPASIGLLTLGLVASVVVGRKKLFSVDLNPGRDTCHSQI